MLALLPSFLSTVAASTFARHVTKAFLAWCVAALFLGAPQQAWAAFGLTADANFYTIDTGSSPNLVFRVRRVDNGSSTQSAGDLSSLIYNGVQYQNTSRGSQVNSGFDFLYNGVSAVTVSAATVGADSIKVTVQAGDLTHYYMARRGLAHIYMGTYFTTEPDTLGLCRFIVRIPAGVLPNGPVPSDIRGTTTTIEASDIFGLLSGETRSKHYSNQRLIDWSSIGATGPGVGVWMARDGHEGGSGGPFYRSLLNQCGSDQEITYIVNYGEAQTEAFRTGILNSYTLIFNGGTAPTAAPDTSWFGEMNLISYVGPQGRGRVTGAVIAGRDARFAYTVGFANATAQYFAPARASDGFFSSAGMLPGTYAMTIYKGELAVHTESVSVAAGEVVTRGTIAISNDPGDPNRGAPLWRIGEWDGSPQEFLNGDKVTTMHPVDVRMSPWAPGPYTVGTSTPAQFPAYQWKDINNGQQVNFTLNSSQISTVTLRIGLTVAHEGARPQISLNSFTSANPIPSTQPNSRTLTVGTYRGNNVTYSYLIPASALVVGQNTLRITAISGTTSSGFLSPGYSFDAIELDGPPPGTYWSGALGANWNSSSGNTGISPDTNWHIDATSGLNAKQFPGIGSNVFFAADGATNLNTTLAQPFSVRGITALNGTGAVGIGGTSLLTLGAGGLTTRSGSGGLTITAPVALGENQIWNGGAATPLSVNGTVSGAATLSAAGNLALSGANTYSGGTIITSGTTVAGSNSALGSGFLAVGGGTLNLSGRSLGVGALSGAAGGVISNASTTAATLLTNSGNNDTAFAGNLTDGAGSVALGKTGAGRLTLSGQNAYSGLTSVQAGTLALSGGALGIAMPNSSSSHLEIAPITGSSAAVNITMGASVSAARVIVGGNVGNTTGGLATLTQNGGVLNSAQWLAIGSQGTGSSTFNLEGGAVNVNSATGTQLEIATFGAASGTLNIANGAQLNLLNNANLALGVINGASGSGTVNQNGGAVTLFSDAGTTPGGTGGLRLGLGTGRTGTYIYNLNGGVLTVPSVSRTSGTGVFNFNGGTLRATGNSANFISNLSRASVQSGGARIDTNGFSVTFSQPLLADATSTGGGLTKNGAGTLTLAGSSTYTGPTTLSAGTLALGAANRIADASDLVLRGTFATGGFSETLGALSAPGEGTIDLGQGASILRFSGLGAGSGTVVVLGYSGSAMGGGTDQLFIGNGQTLSAAQLAQFRFVNPDAIQGTFTAQQLPGGEIVPQIPAVAASGAIISEFRFRGPGGARDEYVELYNKRSAPLNISGWSIQTNSGTLAAPVLQPSAVPANTFILAFGRYLFTGQSFSLGGYGSGDTALSGDAANDSGVALFNAAGEKVDAIGFAGSDPNLREGAGLPTAPTIDAETAFMRSFAGTLPKDTADSSQDFVFVTTSGTAVAGTAGNVASQLGAPSPEGLASPAYANTVVLNALLDPGAAQSAAPNRERVGYVPGGALGDLLIRRNITNGSGRALTRLRFSVASLTTLGTPGPSTQADLRLVSSSDETVTLSNGTSTVQVKGLAIEAGAGGQPLLPIGGGLGSSVVATDVNLTPLGAGETRAFVFRLQIRKSGNFSLLFNFHALPGS